MKKTIKFDLSKTTRPVILNRENYAETIMEEPIDTALSIFDKIISQSLDCMAIDEKSGGLDSDWSFLVNNNIISFLGDRGSGKTSCMLSVANILKRDERNRDLYFLQVIDPSFFDESHNILDLFIGELYKRFKHEASPRAAYDRDTIMRINSSFIELKSNMRYLAVPPITADDAEGAEALEFLCSGVYLQSRLRHAVREFLNFIGKKHLIICIDDLDLNVKRSYQMMEQIRKYLVMPETVIFLSAKIEQLHNAILLDLMNIYKPRTGNSSEEERERLDNTLSLMAERYLSKFLPQSQRVYMPKEEVLLDSAMVIEGEQGKRMEFESVSDGVTDMIFHKTRYLFYNSDGNVSMIVPRNLRNLSHIVRLLFDMPDFDGNVCVTSDSSPAAKQNIINKSRFKNYFFSDWINQLSGSYQEDARSLIAEEPDHLNKPTLNLINNAVPYYLDEPFIQGDNVYYNLSVGDVMEMLETFDSQKPDREARLFSFFVRSLYSMRMYEAYDRLTDTWNSPELLPAPASSDRPLLGISIISDVPEYFRLVGGNLVSPDRHSDFIPGARDRRLLDGSIINNTIRSLLAKFNQWRKDPKKGLPDGFIEKVNLIEFFAYTTVRHVEAKDRKRAENLNDKFRAERDVYYLHNLSATKNIFFDVAAPLVKLADPQAALALYGRDFLEMCLTLDFDDARSLINRLYRDMRYAGSVDRRSDLASRVAVRNMEVLGDIVSYLKRGADDLRPRGEGDIRVYSDFFRYFANYQISTYSLDASTKRHHKITLRPIAILADTLDMCMANEELSELFYGCFAIQEEKRLPGKGTPEASRICAGFEYKPELVRNIIRTHYPEYSDKEHIISMLKFPKLVTMDGEGVVKYLRSRFPGSDLFSKAIGEDLQDVYLAEILASQDKPISGSKIKKNPDPDNK